MAIISFTNYKRGQSTGCMGAVMRYTMQDKKTEFEGQQLITGINCQPESVYADFMTTKRLHHKTDGVLFYHMVQSFPKGETVDPPLRPVHLQNTARVIMVIPPSSWLEAPTTPWPLSPRPAT